MRYAIVENGIVVNVAIANEPLGPDWIADPEGKANIGYLYVDGEFLPPTEEHP